MVPEPGRWRGYPQDAWDSYGADVPQIELGDLEVIATPVDFLGVNYYSRNIVHDATGGTGKIINRRNPVNMMARGWENCPQALTELMTWLHKEYSFPSLMITENGATYDDVLWEGYIHDLSRIDYLRDHIRVLPGLIAAGVPLKGYFCWSLLDNFEWARHARPFRVDLHRLQDAAADD